MIEIRCENCSRYLKIEPAGTIIAKVTCPDRKCKRVNNIKIVNAESSEQDIKFKFKVIE